MEIPTSATYLSEKSRVAHKYLTYPYVRRFLKKKVITQVVSSSGKMMNSLAHIQHSDGQLEFFLRGNWYEESDIRDAMNMQKGRRNKKERKFQISEADDFTGVCGFMNGWAYKNHLENMNMFFSDDSYRTLEFIGSGGSAEKGGGMYKDNRSAFDPNKIVGTLPHNQTLNKINKVLIDCAINDRVVAVFAHSSVCKEVQKMYGTVCGGEDLTSKRVKEMKTRYLCLGYLYVDSVYLADGETIESIRRDYKHMIKAATSTFLRFLEAKKFVVCAKLIDDSLLHGLPVRNTRVGKGDIVCHEKWSVLSIPDDPLEKVLMPIERKDVTDALGLSDKCVKLEDMCKYHVDQVLSDSGMLRGLTTLQDVNTKTYPIAHPKNFSGQDTYAKLQLMQLIQAIHKMSLL
jgi:hypothetical protein